MRDTAGAHTLTGWVGEIVPVGVDFAAAPLVGGETLLLSGEAGAVEARIVDRDNNPRPAGIVSEIWLEGTTAQVRIKPARDDAFVELMAPTSAGNRYGERIYLRWY